MEIISVEYQQWLADLKQRIRECQIKAAVKVNTELLQLYWQTGYDIVEKQKHAHWGDGFLKHLSHDLMEAFPKMTGWDERNLRRMRQWYSTYSQLYTFRAQPVPEIGDLENEFRVQAVPELSQPPIPIDFFSVPWGHHILIMQRCKELDKALFYIQQTVENNWSRSALEWQIDSNLYDRHGKAVSNFVNRLPAPQSDLAQQMTKDPYVIDIMGIRQDMKEREIEQHLDSHISQYLLELGKGFTYYGHQVHLKVGNEDFYIDQLFYHVRLHCYVVVELKAVKFAPEHIGQLNFYVSAVDSQLRTQGDNPTIGLLICKDKDNIVAEYTLRNIESPIGVSSIQIYNELMSDYKSSLPSIEDIERELSDNCR